ncbi:uncharacterized protein LOC117780634 isoform X2 [Drosophila innubila]|uniref:uncharacterized protein LOC117780634 isoform X1 n=1 Tax=Drosophila innubila TaxID=198719 RepID=UPI00148BF4F8|nr:uncharacterized protein LOC117780634 isoform X1 [Drosophila innubila]XP_034473135.1 uncharacterized protein LOC117780634 isoform X2 [Drosophila innubila]
MKSKTPKTRKSPRHPRLSRGSANESPEVPKTAQIKKSDLNMGNSPVLPRKVHKKTKVLKDSLARNFGPVTRRRSLLGFSIGATKRKVEECGEISFNSSHPETGFIPDSDDSPSSPKRARVDETLPNSLTQLSTEVNEINVSLAEKAPTSEESQLKKNIADVNEISKSIRHISIEDNRTIANEVYTPITDFYLKEIRAETKENSKPIDAFLMKDILSPANKIPNAVREFKREEKMSETNVSSKTIENLRIEENMKEAYRCTTPKEKENMSESKEISEPILDIRMTTIKRINDMHRNTSSPILTNLVDIRTGEHSQLETMSRAETIPSSGEDTIEIPNDSNLQQSEEPNLPKEDTRIEERTLRPLISTQQTHHIFGESNEDIVHSSSSSEEEEEKEEYLTLREDVTLQHQRREEEINETEEHETDSADNKSRCNIM